MLNGITNNHSSSISISKTTIRKKTGYTNQDEQRLGRARLQSLAKKKENNASH